MAVRGTNITDRKLRLTRSFLAASHNHNLAAERGDTATMVENEIRARAVRLAWQRLDDHQYPKGH